jgi:hypothetical protein
MERVLNAVGSYATGEAIPGTGRWRCTTCEWAWPLREGERFPQCEICKQPVLWICVSP